MFRHIAHPFHARGFIFWIGISLHLPSLHNDSSRHPSGKPIGIVLSGTYSSMSFTMRTGQDVPGLMSFRRYASITMVLYMLRSALVLNAIDACNGITISAALQIFEPD